MYKVVPFSRELIVTVSCEPLMMLAQPVSEASTATAINVVLICISFSNPFELR